MATTSRTASAFHLSISGRHLNALLLVLCLCLQLPLHAGAQTNQAPGAGQSPLQGRAQVFGAFAVTGGGDSEENQTVTLHFRLVNAGEADLSNAKWTLLVGLPSATQGNPHDIPSFVLSPHGDAKFTYEVTLSRVEYQLLRARRQIFLRLEFQNQNGQTVKQWIALRYAAAAARGN